MTQETTQTDTETRSAPSEASYNSSKTQRKRGGPNERSDVAQLIFGSEPDRDVSGQIPGEMGEPAGDEAENAGSTEERAPTEAPLRDSEEPRVSGEESGEAESAEGGSETPKEFGGLTPEDFYAITVNTGDGESVTVGELKDAYQARETAAQEIVERAAELDRRETGLIQDQRLWAQLGDELTKALPRERIEELMSSLRERDRAEREDLMRVMPELDDPAQMTKFRTEVTERLGKYGFKPHEVVISDHRQMLVLRDLLRAEKRLADLSSFKPKQKAAPGASSPRGRATAVSNQSQLIEKARNSRDPRDKTAAIASLIRGG